MTRIAIMQPYFFPYAGYFRLFAAADLMVIYDDVQFPKEGWVHRNKINNRAGESTWLTLPLKKMPLGTKIRELQYSEKHQDVWHTRLNRFPIFDGNEQLIESAKSLGQTPVDYICKQLEACCALLGLPHNTINSSQLVIDPQLRGQERVLAIVEALGGDEYINAPGGTSLYNREAFRARNIQLGFLEDYSGNYLSILERLLTEPVANISKEVYQQLGVLW